jgi:hypothetical protein
VSFSKETISGEPAPWPDRARRPAGETAVAEAEGQVVRLSPLTVLLLTGDRNFRIVISLLLTRRGCTVVAGRPTESAGRHPADVVLIDAGQSQATASRAMQIADALPPSVGVVLVSGAQCSDTPGRPLLPRWGPFQKLYVAIQEADRRRWIDGG